LPPVEAKLVVPHRFDVPDVLEFGRQPGDFKLIQKEDVDGVPTFRYQDKFHVVDMDRTIDICIGSKDHLPMKTHMLTVTTSALTAPVMW
jgi:hypothetical protein